MRLGLLDFRMKQDCALNLSAAEYINRAMRLSLREKRIPNHPIILSSILFAAIFFNLKTCFRVTELHGFAPVKARFAIIF